MYDFNTLAEMYDMSYKQVRDRVTALRPALDPYLVQGKSNKIQLKETGRALFDRFVQLERQDGYNIHSAAAELKQAIEEDMLHSLNGGDGPDISSEIIQELEQRLAEAEDRLKKLGFQVTDHASNLETLNEQVQLMLPKFQEDDDGHHGHGVESANGHDRRPTAAAAHGNENGNDHNGHEKPRGLWQRIRHRLASLATSTGSPIR